MTLYRLKKCSINVHKLSTYIGIIKKVWKMIIYRYNQIRLKIDYIHTCIGYRIGAHHGRWTCVYLNVQVHNNCNFFPI